jgi:hypothetical protein
MLLGIVRQKGRASEITTRLVAAHWRAESALRCSYKRKAKEPVHATKKQNQ